MTRDDQRPNQNGSSGPQPTRPWIPNHQSAFTTIEQQNAMIMKKIQEHNENLKKPFGTLAYENQNPNKPRSSYKNYDNKLPLRKNVNVDKVPFFGQVGDFSRENRINVTNDNETILPKKFDVQDLKRQTLITEHREPMQSCAEDDLSDHDKLELSNKKIEKIKCRTWSNVSIPIHYPTPYRPHENGSFSNGNLSIKSSPPLTMNGHSTTSKLQLPKLLKRHRSSISKKTLRPECHYIARTRNPSSTSTTTNSNPNKKQTRELQSVYQITIPEEKSFQFKAACSQSENPKAYTEVNRFFDNNLQKYQIVVELMVAKNSKTEGLCQGLEKSKKFSCCKINERMVVFTEDLVTGEKIFTFEDEKTDDKPILANHPKSLPNLIHSNSSSLLIPAPRINSPIDRRRSDGDGLNSGLNMPKLVNNHNPTTKIKPVHLDQRDPVNLNQSLNSSTNSLGRKRKNNPLMDETEETEEIEKEDHSLDSNNDRSRNSSGSTIRSKSPNTNKDQLSRELRRLLPSDGFNVGDGSSSRISPLKRRKNLSGEKQQKNKSPLHDINELSYSEGDQQTKADHNKIKPSAKFKNDKTKQNDKTSTKKEKVLPKSNNHSNKLIIQNCNSSNTKSKSLSSSLSSKIATYKSPHRRNGRSESIKISPITSSSSVIANRHKNRELAKLQNSEGFLMAANSRRSHSRTGGKNEGRESSRALKTPDNHIDLDSDLEYFNPDSVIVEKPKIDFETLLANEKNKKWLQNLTIPKVKLNNRVRNVSGNKGSEWKLTGTPKLKFVYEGAKDHPALHWTFNNIERTNTTHNSDCKLLSRGDCVIIKTHDKTPYLAIIQYFWSDSTLEKEDVKASINWFYRASDVKAELKDHLLKQVRKEERQRGKLNSGDNQNSETQKKKRGRPWWKEKLKQQVTRQSSKESIEGKESQRSRSTSPKSTSKTRIKKETSNESDLKIPTNEKLSPTKNPSILRALDQSAKELYSKELITDQDFLDNPNAVYASKHHDTISVASIDDRCDVLNPTQYFAYIKRCQLMEQGLCDDSRFLLAGTRKNTDSDIVPSDLVSLKTNFMLQFGRQKSNQSKIPSDFEDSIESSVIDADEIKEMEVKKVQPRPVENGYDSSVSLVYFCPGMWDVSEKRIKRELDYKRLL